MVEIYSLNTIQQSEIRTFKNVIKSRNFMSNLNHFFPKLYPYSMYVPWECWVLHQHLTMGYCFWQESVLGRAIGVVPIAPSWLLPLWHPPRAKHLRRVARRQQPWWRDGGVSYRSAQPLVRSSDPSVGCWRGTPHSCMFLQFYYNKVPPTFGIQFTNLRHIYSLYENLKTHTTAAWFSSKCIHHCNPRPLPFMLMFIISTTIIILVHVRQKWRHTEVILPGQHFLYKITLSFNIYMYSCIMHNIIICSDGVSCLIINV